MIFDSSLMPALAEMHVSRIIPGQAEHKNLAFSKFKIKDLLISKE